MSTVILDWFDKMKDTIEYYTATEIELENMAHWLQQYERKDLIPTFSFEKVYNSTKKWMDKLEDRGRHIVENDKDTEIIADLSDNMYLVKLITKAAYESEGSKMRHCVGSYFGNNRITIYSIRDSNNNPHCTFEVDGKEVHQIKGKCNSKVKDKYIPYVFEALDKLDVEVYSRDLINLGLYAIEQEHVAELESICPNFPRRVFKNAVYISADSEYWKNE